ncbi:MAG TPA: hypothetical protein VHO25_03425, partial [Polyangiaceae bacterium]|nr:hypothetical protein [Polyangiaceae bacterium]
MSIPEPPEVPPSPAGILHGHLSQVDGLSTFEEVADWDAKAGQLIAQAAAYLDTLHSLEVTFLAIEAEARAAHQKKSFWARLFTTPTHKGALRQRRTLISQNQTELGKIVDDLQGAIDKTPDSREEKKAMLSDLRSMKKELSIEKREVAAAMRDVRAGARVASARVGSRFLSSPKSRKYERMSIRLEK